MKLLLTILGFRLHLKQVKDKKLKRILIFWFFFRWKKTILYNDWKMRGTTYQVAYKKAKHNVPYFENKKDEERYIRRQKLKRITNN